MASSMSMGWAWPCRVGMSDVGIPSSYLGRRPLGPQSPRMYHRYHPWCPTPCVQRYVPTVNCCEETGPAMMRVSGTIVL